VINNQFYDYGDNANYEIKRSIYKKDSRFQMSKIVGVFYQQVNREIHSVRIIKISGIIIQEILEK
jgi:hypothetical protein